MSGLSKTKRENFAPGITYAHSQPPTWRVAIKRGTANIHVGTFGSAEEAVEAHRLACLAHPRAKYPGRQVRVPQDRFEAKVAKCPMSGCWLWMGVLTHSGSGYGMFFNGTKQQQAHRASWEIHGGKIPDGLCVLHRCDVPSCVNPAHLFIGTQADNVADMISKDRQVRWTKTPECLAQQSATTKETWANPIIRAKRRAAMLEAWRKKKTTSINVLPYPEC